MSAGTIEQSHSAVDLRPFLETVAENEALHMRWLKTLALLEHTGARKIHKSIPFLPAHLRQSEAVLQHAAEEARHAYFFAKQIGRLLSEGEPERRPDPAVLRPMCQWSGIKYFQSLDSLCKQRSVAILGENAGSAEERTLFCYLAVTYLIEERAVQVYRNYETILRERELPIHLSGLLKEEEGHMEEILEMAKQLPLAFEKELGSLRLREEELFVRFAESLSQEALRSAVL